MLHCLEPADHCLDAGPHLFIFLQKIGTFRSQYILALLQRFVLVLQLIAHLDERINALFESFQLVLKGRIYVVSHIRNIDTHPGIINANALRPVSAWLELAFRGIIGPIRVFQDTNRMEQTVHYDELEAALKRCGATWDAAQTHGLLSGRLAIAGSNSGFDWLTQVLEGTDPTDSARSGCEVMLSALFESTYRQLSKRQSEFEPLLPDDSDSAAVRATALGRWCEGFLHGLVSSAHADALKERLSTEPMADIIKDMLQITRATVDDETEDESNEEAYAELVEYLRVAAQLTYEELVEFRGEPAGGDAAGSEAEVLH